MVIIAPRIEKIFSPHRKVLKLFKENYAPSLMRKIIYAGTNCSSFEDAKKNLNVIGEILISQSHIQRLTVRIGKEFDQQDDDTADLWQDIPDQNNSEIEVASVSVDGGRAQIRTEDCGAGVHNPAWLETKVGCLQVLESEEVNNDPHPMLPSAFKNEKDIQHLVAGLKGATMNKQQLSKEKELPSTNNLKGTTKDVGSSYRPKVLKRFAVATIDKSDPFGNYVLHKAYQRQLHTAKRKAYIGDGDRKIWTIYEDYFKQGGWTPILDFIHALEYAFEAAKLCTENELLCWGKYLEFTTHIWQGRVLTVIRRLDKKIDEINSLKKNKNVIEKSEKLQSIRNYFKNNYTKMNYPEYRKKGLPISSCHVESLIKQFNIRVKSTDKFWNKSGLKGMLKLKATFLSEDNSLQNFWDNRYDRQVIAKRAYAKQPV